MTDRCSVWREIVPLVRSAHEAKGFTLPEGFVDDLCGKLESRQKGESSFEIMYAHLMKHGRRRAENAA
jgi:hypothetical protein